MTTCGRSRSASEQARQPKLLAIAVPLPNIGSRRAYQVSIQAGHSMKVNVTIVMIGWRASDFTLRNGDGNELSFRVIIKPKQAFKNKYQRFFQPDYRFSKNKIQLVRQADLTPCSVEKKGAKVNLNLSRREKINLSNT